jgi:hypothetical protein
LLYSLGADPTENTVSILIAQQYVCCLRIRCRANVFTQPLPSNGHMLIRLFHSNGCTRYNINWHLILRYIIYSADASFYKLQRQIQYLIHDILGSHGSEYEYYSPSFSNWRLSAQNFTYSLSFQGNFSYPLVSSENSRIPWPPVKFGHCLYSVKPHAPLPLQRSFTNPLVSSEYSPTNFQNDSILWCII